MKGKWPNLCKIFALTNITKLTHAQINNVVVAAYNKMNDQMDGFGYLYGTKTGYNGKKYVSTSDYAKPLKDFGPSAKELLDLKERQCLGKSMDAPQGGLLVHTRISTNAVSLVNTHPLFNKSFSLIHNGVVDNVGEAIERVSTNDTEYILEHYARGGIEQVAKSCAGYYACAMLDFKTGETVIFRDSRARLSFCYIESIKSYAYATTPETLKNVLKALKTKAKITECPVNFHAVFKADGTLKECSNFTPVSRSFGYLDSKSLGSKYGYVEKEDNWQDKWKNESYWGTSAVKEESKTQVDVDYDDNYVINHPRFGTLTHNAFERLSLEEQDSCSITMASGEEIPMGGVKVS